MSAHADRLFVKRRFLVMANTALYFWPIDAPPLAAAAARYLLAATMRIDIASFTVARSLSKLKRRRRDHSSFCPSIAEIITHAAAVASENGRRSNHGRALFVNRRQ